MEFHPPRRRETSPAGLGTAQQQEVQPASVPTTSAAAPGPSYDSNAQPVYYGPKPETYNHHSAFSPQQEVHYVRAEEARAESDDWAAGQWPKFMTDEDYIPPPPTEPPGPRPSSPIGARRRGDSNTYSKRARFDDDDYSSENEMYSGVKREVTRSWHTPSRGSGYTRNDGSTVYSFAPSRASRAPSYSRTANTDEEEAEKSENGSASQESGTSRVRATYVFESRYTGESRLGDPHTVKLSVQRTTAVKQRHLFRWIHTTRSSMIFDEFANIASQLPALDASERKAIAQLLPRVRRKVKTIQTSTGKSVQYMEPAVVPHRISDGGKNRSVVSRTAAWVCLPYLSLENYAGLLSAESSSEFPIQTLLQAQYSKTARDRDMQQAICQIDRRGKGRCFHIAQLWCIIIDKSLLLTYGRMTEDALCAESRDGTTQITMENTMIQVKPRLLVSHRGSAVWGFPLEECQTWTDFLSHFREFWPRRLVFFLHRRQLNAEDWPRIWHNAQRVSTNLAIDMDVGPNPKPPPRRLEQLVHDTQTPGTESLTQKQQAGLKSSVEQTRKLSPGWMPDISSKTPSVPRLGCVSIFAFLEGVSQPAGIDESVLNEHLLEIEDFLLSHTNFTDRKAYRSCRTSSRNDVHAILETRGSTLSQSANVSNADQLDYEEDVDVFNTADIIFRFFFPADADVATVGKFWGAIKFLIGQSQGGDPALPRKVRRQLPAIGRVTRSLAITIMSFNETIGHSIDSDQLDMVVPDELKNAWLHLTMGLLFVPHDEVMSETLLVQAQHLIEESIENIVKSLSTKSLVDNAVILPIELFTLLGLKMLQDSTAGLPDISHTYSAYLESVAADILNKPSDRSHERRIGLLKQELSIIVKTFDAQSRVLESLEREFKPQLTKREDILSSNNPNISSEYSRGWTEPSRARSSHKYPDVSDRSYMHNMYQPRPYEWARPRYQENDISTRTVYDRDNRTNVGYYDEDAHAHYNPTQSNPDFKLAPTDVGGFRKLFTEECFRHIERRRREFGEFRYQATLLEEENQNKVETTKDRQERAIYAFTIVTVIFLPLSSVASIFGINTKDVRDTDLSQWAYWATAVPVTAAVVFFGLLWTGELGNILRWVSSFGSRVGKGRYQWIPDDYNDGDDFVDRLARGYKYDLRREREPLGGYRSRFASPPPRLPPPLASPVSPPVLVRRRGTFY